MSTAPDLTNALAPVRNALLQAARADAKEMLNEADDRARDATAAARRRAEAARAAARAAGIAAAEQALAAARTSHQRQARTASLQARHEAYQQLREQVRAAATQLSTGPEYPELRATLVNAARRLLAPDAVITDAPGGGITASSGNRRLDLSLATFADRAADRVAVRLVET